MGRVMSRVKHDELVRMIKAVRTCGLPIARVTFDGDRLDVIIGESGENAQTSLDVRDERGGLIREPQV